MTQLRDDLITFEVPEGLLMASYEVERTLHAIMTNGDESELVVRYIQRRCGSPEGKVTISLPPGSWQLLCTTKEATEEQAQGIVRELPVGNRWHNYNGDYPVWWHSAKESLNSLLTSKGLDPNKNYALLKKG